MWRYLGGEEGVPELGLPAPALQCQAPASRLTAPRSPPWPSHVPRAQEGPRPGGTKAKGFDGPPLASLTTRDPELQDSMLSG